ncbi:MAG: ABC transporter substrate-binding protein [Bacilli bacterium]|nr:ABC transporter substrate-binding protein [Bacilli bacterium]
MKTKKIFSICLLFILTLILSGCGKNKNEIIMVTEAGFAPYEYYENGEIVGVDVAIAKEIAKELGKKLVVKNVDFDSIVSELKSGKADFAAAGMSITEERKKQVDFTIEYVTSNQVVVVKKDSSLNDITQLDGKRIAVQLGTVGDSYVTENYKNSEINRQKKFLVAAEAVKNNKADCIVMDQIPAQQLVSQNPELKILDGILFKDSYGMAVKKGNTELLDTMNTVLQRLIDEGKIEEYIIEYSK